MSSYLYTNWRGKTFIIDDIFVDKLKKSLTEDGSPIEDFKYLTPEYLTEVLPDMERWDRHFELELMWEKQNP